MASFYDIDQIYMDFAQSAPVHSNDDSLLQTIDDAVKIDLENVVNLYKESHREWITICATKYNDKHYCIMPINDTIMKHILNNEAYYCLIYYLHLYPTMTVISFWSHYNGKSKILYEMIKNYGKGIDDQWMQSRLSSQDKERREELSNILSWMGEDYIISNIELLMSYATIIGQLYSLDVFINHILLYPNNKLDIFISKMNKEKEIREYMSSIMNNKVLLRQIEKKYDNKYPLEYKIFKIFKECKG